MSETQEKYTPRLLEIYRNELLAKLKDKFGYTNDLAAPRLVKIVINMGIGEGTSDAKLVEKAAQELAQIAGQKAKICRGRNFSISS